MYAAAGINIHDFTNHEEDRGNVDEVSRKTVFPGQLVQRSLTQRKRREKNVNQPILHQLFSGNLSSRTQRPTETSLKERGNRSVHWCGKNCFLFFFKIVCRRWMETRSSSSPLTSVFHHLLNETLLGLNGDTIACFKVYILNLETTLEQVSQSMIYPFVPGINTLILTCISWQLCWFLLEQIYIFTFINIPWVAGTFSSE